METNDYNTANELKHDSSLIGGEGKIRQLLGELKRFDAPPNFDFGLRRKIAAHQPETVKKSRLLPVLRLALPLSLLILFAAFVGFDLFLSPQIGDVPAVAENILPPPPKNSVVAENAPVNTASPNVLQIPNFRETAAQITVPNPKAAKPISPATGKSEKPSLAKDSEEDFSGTRDSALTSSRTILPKGLNQNQKPAAAENVLNNKPITVRQILSQLGIEADFAEDNWKVRSVKEHSLAERSGVKNGDLLEAIDDRELDSETVFTQSYSGKTIHLTRDGKKIALNLGASQPK